MIDVERHVSDPGAPALATLLLESVRPAGSTLVEECARQDSLYFLRSGRVEVSVAGLKVGELGPGALIGEISLFANSERTATVTASTEISVFELSRASFAKLRAQGHGLAHDIEQHALAQLMTRMRQLTSDLKIQARGSSLPDTEDAEPAAVIEVPLPEAALVASLESSPLFQGVEGALEPLAIGARMGTLPEGAMVADRGWKQGPLFLLTGGEVEWRLLVDGANIPVGSIMPGELFALPLHVDKKARPVAYVAVQPSSFLMLDPETIASLFQSATPTGARLRTAAIRALSDRVLQLNARFTLLKLTAVGIQAAPATPYDPQEMIVTLNPGWDEEPEDTDTWDTWFELVDEEQTLPNPD